MLQCSCEFTRLGLETVLNSACDESDNNAVFSISSLKQAEDKLISQRGLGVIILELSYLNYNVLALLEVMNRHIPRHHPNSKVLIFTDAKCNDAVKRYLAGMENVSRVLSINDSIEKIKSEFSRINQPDQIEHTSVVKKTNVLSSREMNILQSLLKGKSVEQLACELTLNHKTISSHKRSAMRKLGIHSFPPLLISP